MGRLEEKSARSAHELLNKFQARPGEVLFL